ncbi:3-methyl-2-oxobutanoate hydroxymethyltransferase [Calidifontibacter terrae]
MSEEPAPYGAAQPASRPRRRIRTVHLQQMKQRGERWSMLTAYDQYTAAIFDEAGIEVLLVGDSAGNNVFGYDTTLPVTLEEFIPLVRAVSGAAKHSLVIADMLFGTYGGSVQQGFDAAVRLMKEGRAHGVKIEGGVAMVPTIKAITDAGIPVIAHIGFTPQSEHNLGGYRVQGRGDSAERMVEEAKALQEAGAFAVLMEMVPAPVAAAVTKSLSVPTIGIGAGPDCDAQVLVWQDMAGLRTGKAPRFVKRYANLHDVLLQAATDYRDDVVGGTFPDEQTSFAD